MSIKAGPRQSAEGRLSILGTVVAMIGVALAYYGGAKLGLRLAIVEENVTLLWPPTGIALAALLIYGYRMWPAIALAAFAVNAPISPSMGAAAVIAAGNTLAPVAASFLLHRLDFQPQMERVQDVLGLVLGAALTAMTISATVGSATLVGSGAIPSGAFASTWAAWWVGDVMGVLVFAPLLLIMRTIRRTSRVSWRRAAEASAFFVLITATTRLIFANELRLLYLVFPLVMLTVWRFQLRGAPPAVMVVSLIAVIAASNGSEPFASGRAIENMIVLQAFNGGIALTAFILAAMMSERTVTLKALERAGAELEDHVDQRTAQLQSSMEAHELIENRLAEAQALAHVGSWEWDMPINVVTWTDELFRLYGLEPQSIAVDYEAFISRVHPDDKEMVDGVVRNAASDLHPFHFDHRVVLPSGGTTWLHARGKVMVDDTGHAIRMSGTAQDISERKRAEEYAARLHEVEARRQQGLELNDEVVQGLVVAKYALDLGQDDRALGVVEGTLRSARKIVTELLGDGRELQPGDLIRRKAADVTVGGS